jgi:hypothetical protein
MREFENNSNELELLSKNSKINSFLNINLEEMEKEFGTCAHVPVSLIETLIKYTRIDSTASRDSLGYDLAQRIRMVATQVREAASNEGIISLRDYATKELSYLIQEIAIEEVIITLKNE